jgi:hypothetical protein
METWIIALLVLVAVLFVGQIVYNETFVDASDNSGSVIQLTLSDLMSLLGTQSSASTSTSTPSQQPIIIQPPSYDTQFSSLKDAILSDVKQTVQDEIVSGSLRGLAAGSAGGGVCADVMDDSCIESMANLQGSEFMKYIPGKNPADYIRKDSVPCYGCSLPS